MDGLAFLLAEQLLAPGGHLIFAALHWSIASSGSLSEQTKHLPTDYRDSQHVKLVCEELVKSHPNIAEYWEDPRWGFARKHTRGETLGEEQRSVARGLMGKQAEIARQRAQRAWEAGDVEGLVAPHVLTGTRPTLAAPS